MTKMNPWEATAYFSPRLAALQARSSSAEVFSVVVAAAPNSFGHVLSVQECGRAMALLDPSARAQFVSSRRALRALLSERTGIAPGAIEIHVSSGQAPVAPRSGWWFSLSHTPRLCLIALTRNDRIGVDIEPVCAFDDALALARRFFHPQELEWLASRCDDARALEFLRLWVRKEAVAKAAGLGLAMRFDDWTALPPRPCDSCFDLVDPSGRPWRVHDLVPDIGHVAAVVTSRCVRRVYLSKFD